MTEQVAREELALCLCQPEPLAAARRWADLADNDSQLAEQVRALLIEHTLGQRQPHQTVAELHRMSRGEP